jgi:hypothetical protein
MPEYRREPSNRELRERVVAYLKETRLFAAVSVRLIADLVDRTDFVEVPPAPAVAGGWNPALLVLPEAPVDVYMEAVTVWPPPPFLVHVPASAQPIALATGVHLRNLGALRGLTHWTHARLRAVGDRPVRVFQLSRAEFPAELPRVVLNALELSLADIVAS